MPDPQDPTPCRAEKRGNLWVIVDASGKKVAGAGAYKDEATAKAEAEQINTSWKRAKSERKSKGLSEAKTAAAIHFDAALHPRDRLGRFRDVLTRLSVGQRALLRGEGGERASVVRTNTGFKVEGGKERVKTKVATPVAAAQMALRGVGHEEAGPEDLSPAERRAAAEKLYPRRVREIDKIIAPVMVEKPEGGEREGMEGPFRYRSGWEGYYDPKEGRYYDPRRDMFMPRNFDPETGEGAVGLGTVGDVLRAKSAGGETTTEWAKRTSAQSLLRKHGIPYDRSAEELSQKPDIERLPGGGLRVIWRYEDFEGPDKSHTWPMAVDISLSGEVKNAETEHFGRGFSSSGGRAFGAGSKISEGSLTAVTEARKRAAAEHDHVAFTRYRREERELREELRLLEARHPTGYHFDPRLHPRNRLGEFTDVLASLRKAARGSEVILPHEVTVRRRGKAFDVSVGRKRVGVHLRREKAARKALEQFDQAQAAHPFTVKKYPDIAHLRRLADIAGGFVEKPEAIEIGERVRVLPEQEGDLQVRGILRGRQNGQAEVELVTSGTTLSVPEAQIRRPISKAEGGMGVEKPEGDAIDQVLSLGIGGKFTVRGRTHTVREFGGWTHAEGKSIVPVWNEKGKPTRVTIRSGDKVTLDDSAGWHPWMGSQHERLQRPR